MSKSDSLQHLSKRAMRRIERNVRKTFHHPAVATPLRYNLDWIATVTIGALFVFVALLFLQEFITHPLHARAPELNINGFSVEAQIQTTPY